MACTVQNSFNHLAILDLGVSSEQLYLHIKVKKSWTGEKPLFFI